MISFPNSTENALRIFARRINKIFMKNINKSWISGGGALKNCSYIMQVLTRRETFVCWLLTKDESHNKNAQISDLEIIIILFCFGKIAYIYKADDYSYRYLFANYRRNTHWGICVLRSERTSQPHYRIYLTWRVSRGMRTTKKSFCKSHYHTTPSLDTTNACTSSSYIKYHLRSRAIPQSHSGYLE